MPIIENHKFQVPVNNLLDIIIKPNQMFKIGVQS